MAKWSIVKFPSVIVAFIQIWNGMNKQGKAVSAIESILKYLKNALDFFPITFSGVTE